MIKKLEDLEGLSIKDSKNMPSAILLNEWEYKYYIDEETQTFKLYRCKDCKKIKKCTELLTYEDGKHLCVPCEITEDNKLKSDYYSKFN